MVSRMPRKPPVATLVRELVTAHGLDRATEIAEALGGKSSNLCVRISAARLAAWKADAKRRGITLTAWLERAGDAALKR